ncbi:hypothetical protein P9112_009526 [Eukaryota sp. TZLM1-RC]
MSSVNDIISFYLDLLPKAHTLYICPTFEEVIKWHGGYPKLLALGFTSLLPLSHLLSNQNSNQNTCTIITDSITTSLLSFTSTSSTPARHLVSLIPEFVLEYLPNPNPNPISFSQLSPSFTSITYLPLVYCSPFPNTIVLSRPNAYSLSLYEGSRDGEVSKVLFAIDLIGFMLSIGASRQSIIINCLGSVSQSITKRIVDFVHLFPEFPQIKSNILNLNLFLTERGIDCASVITSSIKKDGKSNLLSDLYNTCHFGSFNDVMIGCDSPFNPLVDEGQPLISSLISDLNPTLKDDLFSSTDIDTCKELIQSFLIDTFELDESTLLSEILTAKAGETSKLSKFEFSLLRLGLALENSTVKSTVQSTVVKIISKYFTSGNLIKNSWMEQVKIILNDKEFSHNTSSNLIEIIWILCLLCVTRSVPVSSQSISPIKSYLIDYIINWVVKSPNPSINFFNSDINNALLELFNNRNDSSSEHFINAFNKCRLLLDDELYRILINLNAISQIKLDLSFITYPSRGFFNFLSHQFINNQLSCEKFTTHKQLENLISSAFSFMRGQKSRGRSRDVGQKLIDSHSVCMFGGASFNEILNISSELKGGFFICSRITNTEEMIKDLIVNK